MFLGWERLVYDVKNLKPDKKNTNRMVARRHLFGARCSAGAPSANLTPNMAPGGLGTLSNYEKVFNCLKTKF